MLLGLVACVETMGAGKGTGDDTGSGHDPGTGDTDTAGPVGLAHAAEPIYVHTGDTLYTWDLDTQQASRLGRFETLDGVNITGMVDIAIDEDGVMYGAEGTTLYRIDAEDARCDRYGPLTTRGTGLTFAGDGRLVVAGEALVAMDLGTGVEETLVEAGTWTTSGDVVGVPSGTLEWSVRGDAGDEWVSFDPSTNVGSTIGAVGASSLWGVAYAEGELYAFSGDGYVYIVDPASGAGTFVVDGGLSFWGATTNPVTW